MSDTEYKLPGSVASLPVLAHSARVEQLRGEPHIPTARPDHPVSAVAAAPEMDLMPDSIERKLIEGKIIAAISKVYDPEIPVNVYELGLIYGIDIYQDRSVRVRMTLTAPGCPVAGSLPGEVEKQVETVDEVKEAEVILIWEPAWDKSRMSEAAMLQLGM
jgi:FeS assembly SUF system protein